MNIYYEKWITDPTEDEGAITWSRDDVLSSVSSFLSWLDPRIFSEDNTSLPSHLFNITPLPGCR